MSLHALSRLQVGIDFGDGLVRPVGSMLRSSEGSIYFQFVPEFLAAYLPLSPFKLRPLATAQGPGPAVFDGLFGAFADSLPDSWGMLMMRRVLRRAGIDYAAISPLERLAYVGSHGMGAFVYHPAYGFDATSRGDALVDLEALAREAEQMMVGDEHEILPLLARLGGSAGGARPKVLVGVSVEGNSKQIISGVDVLPAGYEHWIVKFRGYNEQTDAGIVEWAYAQTAAKVGLQVAETRLFSGGNGPWFGTKRFDRSGNRRFHLHTLAALLHVDFRSPVVDYEMLLKVASSLTRRRDDLEAAFRLAAFNVVFHNRDDHAKNFSFVMDQSGTWRLSPAYDLTYNSGPGGEHTSAVAGEGRSPGRSDLMRLAGKAGINISDAQLIVDEVEDGRPLLLSLLAQHGVKRHPIQKVLARGSSPPPTLATVTTLQAAPPATAETTLAPAATSCANGERCLNPQSHLRPTRLRRRSGLCSYCARAIGRDV